jgi:tetratricopeptide (TPR) repeat protein
VAVAVPAQEQVGRVTDIDGWAEIDAFGAGQYIEAEEGDALYADTVLRTDFDTWMTIQVQGQEFEIAPRSESEVSAFIAQRKRADRPGVIARLIRSIGNSLAPPEEDVADFGGRASEAATADQYGGFITDVNVNDEFADGVEALEAGNYREAVDHLKRIEYPEEGDFDLEEYYVQLSYALLGLGDFDAALDAAFEYQLVEPSVADVEGLPPRLQMLAGIGAYYAGDDRIAERAAGEYIGSVGLKGADAQVIAIRILATRERDRRAADSLENRARRERSEVDWDSLL